MTFRIAVDHMAFTQAAHVSDSDVVVESDETNNEATFATTVVSGVVASPT